MIEQIEYSDIKKVKELDWLDRRVFYLLDAWFGPNIRHTFWNDSNPVDFFVLPIYLSRGIWRAWRNRK